MELRKSVTKLVPNATHVHSAGRWLIVLLTTVAALIGILVNARSLGLTPWLGSGTGFANLAARRVVLAPAYDTLTAIGDTVQLAATVTDQHGAVVSGASVMWASEDSAIAAVDSSGAVTARGPGTTTVSATVHDRVGQARITVAQRVRAVAIARDTVVRLPEGGSLQLLARSLDARGRLVAGRTVRWESADTTVVTVTPSGSASARAPGATTLTASIEGYAASVPVEVTLAAASARLLSGGDQRASAGRLLPQSVTVQVLSHGGRPVPGWSVTFTPQDGGKADAEAVTDRDGRAHASWTLGPPAGRQHLAVRVAGVDTTVVVTAEADPLPSNTRVQPAGEAPLGTAGAALAAPVGIRVTDSSGTAVADVPVAWITPDGGAIEALAPRTDSLGQAWARWTLGRRAGPQRARVQVGNPRTMPPFTVTATALAGPAASASIVSGGDQSGPAGAALRHPIVVRLTDSLGNVAAGATLRAAAVSGSVAETLLVTGQDGRASLVWTLGRQAGPQALQITPGVGGIVRVGATARPLEPANLSPGPTPHSAPAGRALPRPVPFVVTDAYGNAIADVQIAFTTTSGSVSPVRVMSDAKGQATTRWTLGSRAGEDTLTATVRGTTVTGSVVVRGVKRTTGR